MKRGGGGKKSICSLIIHSMFIKINFGSCKVVDFIEVNIWKRHTVHQHLHEQIDKFSSSQLRYLDGKTEALDRLIWDTDLVHSTFGTICDYCFALLRPKLISTSFVYNDVCRMWMGTRGRLRVIICWEDDYCCLNCVYLPFICLTKGCVSESIPYVKRLSSHHEFRFFFLFEIYSNQRYRTSANQNIRRNIIKLDLIFEIVPYPSPQ